VWRARLAGVIYTANAHAFNSVSVIASRYATYSPFDDDHRRLLLLLADATVLLIQLLTLRYALPS